MLSSSRTSSEVEESFAPGEECSGRGCADFMRVLGVHVSWPNKIKYATRQEITVSPGDPGQGSSRMFARTQCRQDYDFLDQFLHVEFRGDKRLLQSPSCVGAVGK